MKRPSKETRIQMLENRLTQYENQHESLEHDTIAALATGAEDAEEAVEKIREQQLHIELAHEAIAEELNKLKTPKMSTVKKKR
jgi:archaellum component FlaC